MLAFQKSNFQDPTPKQSRTNWFHTNFKGHKIWAKKGFLENPQVLTGPLLQAKYLGHKGEMKENECHPLESLHLGDSKYPTVRQ